MEDQLLVEEIHAAFDAAEDDQLTEADVTIKDNEVKDVEHVKHLVETGFKNSKAVTDAKEKLDRAIEAEEQAKTVLHYRETYPFLKFLTEKKLDEICEKYNLIYAPVDRYLMDVPKKNMDEILNAQELKRDDKKPHQWKIVGKVKFYKGITKEQQKKILDATYDIEPSGGVINTIFPELETSWIYKETPEMERMDFDGLFIAAPKTHFNLKGLIAGKTKGFFQKITQKMPPDPIVFRYVKGGIQVLSKWGIEANDPALANPLDN